MKKRQLSLLLCLVMVFALFPTFAAPAMAADANGITNPDPATDTSGKLNLTKTLAPGQNGTYDITMESWATGEVKTQGITEKIPTDFVVVVDQSGSMDTKDMPTGDPTVQNNKYLEDIAAGAYYYKDGDNYYRVYGVKDYLYRYYPANTWFTGDIVEHLGTDIGWFMGQTDATTNIDNAFYFREVVGDQTYYIPIRTTIEGKVGTYYMKFSFPSKRTGSTYEFDREVTTYSTNGKSPWYHNVTNGELLNSGALYEGADFIVQGIYRDDHAYTYSEVKGDGLLSWIHIRTGMYVNYPMYGRHLSYTKLCYRDVNGVEHEVASNSNGRTTWEYCDDNGIARTTDSVTSARPTYSGLYTFSGTTDRITALKAALTEFAQAVANETDSFGKVDNRVSIVGFSSSGYNNTELLTHTERNITGSSTNGWQKSTCDNNVTEYYGKGLVDSTNGTAGTVNTKITRAITAITANGGTQPEDGLNMAYKVLTNRGTGEGKTTYTIRSGANKDQVVDRNTVVIFFTDGQPGDYHESNQYSEANQVVAQAKQIKDYGKTLDYGTSLYSIGVFGESDANPLTYADTSQSQSNRQAWKYLGGWMETYYSGGTYYCLRRQWRPNNADGYTATPNDTIYDYMSVVSSNYPDAKNFIAPAWLSGTFSGNYIAATDGDAVRQKSTAEATNKYYRMASNQDTLVSAFLQAVTMNNEEITSDTSVPLNETAIFKDKVNLTDFDITGATYTVKWQPVKEQNGQIVNNGNASTKVSGAAVPADGQVNYSGFNYSENFVTSAHNGQKLVVTITGLTPKKASGTLYSNDGKAGVYGPEDEDPTVSIASPTLEFPASSAKTYVIDFNAKMTVATDAAKLAGAQNDTVTGDNGKFVKSGTNVTYQLDTQQQTGTTVQINKAYNSVDAATVYGKLANVEGDALGWKQITTIPAGSVYYDDDLAAGSAITVGDGSGYNAGVGASPTEENTAKGRYTFAFYGTGIDVYCTTNTDGGMVQYMVDGQMSTAAAMKNYSVTERYNVPTISVRDLSQGEHTLTINVLGSSNYKLDGIRVYNPVSNETYEGQGTHEQYATFINLREALVNDNGVSQAFSDSMTEAVLGALFIDDATKLNVQKQAVDANTGNPVVDENNNPVMIDAYESEFVAYKENSPKHEIYLKNNQAITFVLSADAYNAAVAGSLWIGLSAPDAGKQSGTVEFKAGVTQQISTAVDEYYPITPDRIGANNTVTIKNTGDNMISVTNLKITGNQDIYDAANTPKAGTASVSEGASVLSAEDVVPMVFAPVTMQTVKIAANDGVDPDAPAPDPTPSPDPTPDPTSGPQSWISQLISNFVSMLFRSIARLFGN